MNDPKTKNIFSSTQNSVFFPIWRQPKVDTTEEPTTSKISQLTVAGSPRRRRLGAGGKRPKREEAHEKNVHSLQGGNSCTGARVAPAEKFGLGRKF